MNLNRPGVAIATKLVHVDSICTLIDWDKVVLVGAESSNQIRSFHTHSSIAFTLYLVSHQIIALHLPQVIIMLVGAESSNQVQSVHTHSSVARLS